MSQYSDSLVQVCPRLYIRFTPSIRESYSELHLLRLGRFGKDSYARVLLHCLPNGVETVPAQSERKSEVRARTGSPVSLYLCVNASDTQSRSLVNLFKLWVGLEVL